MGDVHQCGQVGLDSPGRSPTFHRTSFLELAPLPGAIPCARLHTVAVLHEWGLRELAEDAALIVSELMTNAAEAAMLLPDRPPIALRLLASEKSLIFEAWDHSPLDVEPREPDPDAECGRGLMVVAALSERWGWERTGHNRKVVWAALVTGAAPGAPYEAGASTNARPLPLKQACYISECI